MRSASVRGNFLHLNFNGDSNFSNILADLKTVPRYDRQFKSAGKYWSVKLSVQSISIVIKYDFEISDSDSEKIMERLEPLLQLEENKESKFSLSRATQAEIIPEIANQMRLPAWDFQWVPVNYALFCNAKMLCCDAMAAGKSVESLMIWHHPNYRKKKCIVIAKTPETFQKEFHKFFKGKSMIVNESMPYLFHDVDIYITSYLKQKFFFKDLEEKIPYDYVKDCFFIYDEIQEAKNPDTLKHKYAAALLEEVQHKILMTGTLIMNKAIEAYYILRLLDKNIINYNAFMARFCGLTYNRHGVDVDTNKSDYNALNEFLHQNVMVRREDKEIGSQLPPMRRQSYLIKEKPVSFPKVRSIWELYTQSAQAKAKDNDFIDMIETLLEETEGKKIGFFAVHHVVLDALEQICIKNKVKYIRLDGKSPPASQRQNYCDRFYNDPTIQAFIGSIQVGGTGLNNLHCCNVDVFCEFPWTSGEVLQAEKRFNRPGSVDPLLTIFLLYSKMEYRQSELILEKLSLIEQSIGMGFVEEDKTIMQVLSQEFDLPIGAPT